MRYLYIFLIPVIILGCNNRGIEDVIPEPEIQKMDFKEKTSQQETLPQGKHTPIMPQKHKIEEINWYNSFEEGVKAAKEKKKPLMVDFEAEWCIWCKRLDETTYIHPQIIALAKKFIPVKVNCDKDLTTPRKYGVKGLPTIIFMTSEGEVIHQIIGYRTPQEFAIEMKKVIGK